MVTPSWTLDVLRNPRDPPNRVSWILDFLRNPTDPATGSLGPWAFSHPPRCSQDAPKMPRIWLKIAQNRSLLPARCARRDKIGPNSPQKGLEFFEWSDVCHRCAPKCLPGRVIVWPPGPNRVPWILDFWRCPRDPPNRVPWILDFSERPRDPPNRVSWTLD